MKKTYLTILWNFPKAFPQVPTSQGYFPKCQLPKGISPSANFPAVQFPKRQLTKYILAAALGTLACLVAVLGPLTYHSHSAHPQLQPEAPLRA